MKRKVKIPLIIIGFVILNLVIASSGFLLIICINDHLNSNQLDFADDSFIGMKKTPIEGIVEDMDINYYDKKDITGLSKAKYTYDYPVFPSNLTNGSAKGFLFIDPLFLDKSYPRAELYLEWTTNQEMFEKEEERLSEYIAITNKKILLSENLFLLKSYIASYNFDGKFEYAIFDEKTFTIRYIYLCDIGKKENIVFPYEYAPTKFLKDSDISQYAVRGGEYSINEY